jgi:hypothetical protein
MGKGGGDYTTDQLHFRSIWKGGEKLHLTRKSMFVGIAVTVVLVLAGGIAGIALASDNTDTGKTLLGRVATILGIDQQKVEDAFKQAQKDMQAEALDNFLKAQVGNGRITQAQADQYKTWWNARPDVPADFGSGGPRQFRGRTGGPGCWQSPAPPAIQQSTTN